MTRPQNKKNEKKIARTFFQENVSENHAVGPT